MSRYLKSLIELVVATYALSFVGTITAAGFDLADISTIKAAAVAAVPAALAVLYGAVARFVGSFDSALAVDTRPGNE